MNIFFSLKVFWSLTCSLSLFPGIGSAGDNLKIKLEPLSESSVSKAVSNEVVFESKLYCDAFKREDNTF